ncbi:hypothetical protein N1851_013149 [Merluccius polli]|uniref:Reverse transcriptase n=1 Tax=Merluccius polli TaxID=89951 RepID=A0AA47MWG1_MERPO|nr:hypothetical protein N1851_013149 [Merluccius polli]
MNKGKKRHFTESELEIVVNDVEPRREILSGPLSAGINMKRKEMSGRPDKISGILLKSCARQLSPIFHHIFNVSLSQQKVPRLWKQAEMIPVPKVSKPKMLNDFRPVALTSLLMKSFEKIVKSELLGRTAHALDPMQFAYRAHRGVEDATLTLLNL